MNLSTVRLMLLFLCMGTASVQAHASSAVSTDSRSAASKVHGETKGGGDAVYIIRLAADPVATYKGDIAGLKATSPTATGESRLNARSSASRAYDAYLKSQQQRFLKDLGALLGRVPDVRFEYRHAFNGVAVLLSPREALQVAAMKGVVELSRDRNEQLLTDAGPAFIGATDIWGGGLESLSHLVQLSGANEVPPNNSLASGSGSFTYDLGTRELQYSISISGMTPTAAHIHDGAAGINGGVLHTLDNSSNPLQGTLTLSVDEQAKLANGGLYVNVHSAAFGSGEIRGQIEIAGTLGEGIIVGVLDTGINQGHPSFAPIAGDGYVHSNPNGSGNYLGYCVANPSFCNDKLIGAWAFHADSTDPADTGGHGSHTAGTAAGNIISNAQFNAPTQTLAFPFVAGVAPRATIIAYQVCFPQCPTSATAAAVNQAVIDGVHVINYSISGGSRPYTEPTEIAFRNAAVAGILVATSAGNSGPAAATVGHQTPWVTTVAANTHNREIRNVLGGLISSGGPHPDISGEAATTGFGPAPLVYAGAAPFNNALCDTFPPGTFTGQIVVCDRGFFNRIQKGANVLAGGGGGMILANDLPNASSLSSEGHVLPAVHIGFSDGVSLRNWLASGSGHMGSISGGSVALDGPGYNMASFSSRGPAGASVAGLANMIKPDISAPGLNILAAYSAGSSTPPEFNIISGTSMSSPHVAGALALMRALHPEWTPAEIKSALMSTAVDGIRKEDNTTPGNPFDFGAGGAELRAAPYAGFVLDISEAEYLAANPDTYGDPRLLNLPSMADSTCTSACSWTRTLRSVLDQSQEYTATVIAPNGSMASVTPSSFTLAAGASQVLNIAYSTGSAPIGAWAFAELVIEAVGPGPNARMPIAVKPERSNLPARVTIAAQDSAGTFTLGGRRAIEITNLTSAISGLTQATITTQSAIEDPTNGDPYDGGDGVFFVTLDVPAGAQRLVAEIIASEAPDVDFFVGLGSAPSQGSQVCSGATGSALEYCNIDNPDAGTWWVLVQNWTGSSDQPDAITLATVAVPAGSAGNLSVADPGSVPAGQPFDLGINWNSPAIVEGTRWYGSLVLGTDAGNPDNLGRINVDLFRATSELIFTDGFEGD